MKKHKLSISPAGSARYAVALVTVVFALTFLDGCEQPLGPGMTYHTVTNLWPIFDVEKSEGIDDDGTRWKKEKGDAVCWLSTWEKEEKRDKEGFLIYSLKKESSFLGLFSSEVEETEKYRNKKGNVLFWPYQSRRRKTLENN